MVDIDLEKFFDRVNHDMLMARVARVVKDKRVLKLIRAYLNSGVMVEGVVIDTEEGTPQGGPLSPLLSNIMLDDLDKELEKRGHKFVRYADDCNIYVKTQRAGERVMESVKAFLEKKLKLKVNPKKSKVDRASRVKILGFSFFKRNGEVLIRSCEAEQGTLCGEATPPDEAYPVRQAGRRDPGDQPVHDGLDRILPAGEYAERV